MEAYRRVEFDARVEGASGPQLVGLCYEQLTGALGTAIHAHETGDNMLKSRSLTRALSAVTVLQMGISGENDVTDALHRFYEAARRTLLDSALACKISDLRRLRADFVEIGLALQAA